MTVGTSLIAPIPQIDLKRPKLVETQEARVNVFNGFSETYMHCLNPLCDVAN
jgi:hypothetical protein